MPQLNIYVSERLARTIRTRARAEGRSLSQLVTSLLELQLVPPAWDKDFFTSVMGSWKGKFPPVERPPPEEREGL